MFLSPAFFSKNKLALACATSLSLFSITGVAAQEAMPDHIVSYTDNNSGIEIPRISGEITVDGKLDEPEWHQATRVSINNVTRPFNNIPSPVETEALLMEIDGVFHLAFIAQDPDPSQIRAYLRDRDRAWEDDIVGIKIDSFNDQRTAYRFLVNPLGAQIDGIENETTKRESDSWDGIWDSAGLINENGYVVEMALPLSMLNFNENKPFQTWGIELMRMYPRDERLRLSNIYLDRANDCELCQLVPAKGFKDVKQGSNLIIAPSLVASVNESRDDDNVETGEKASWERETNVEPSLDVRWGITPDILLNATINPDFSTIETDSARIDVNNTFAFSYEEKRPFFLDNKDYFDSNYNLVYTRNINAPNYGAKLTGRKDDHSLGLFITDDKSTNILIPGNRSSSIAEIEGESKAAALRYRYNYNDNITLGWISTLRDAKDYQNSVHGIDARFRLSTYDVFKFQTLTSKTQYPADLFKQFCDDEDDCQPPTDDNNCDLTGCKYSESALRTINSQPFRGNAYRAGYYHNDSAWHYKATFDKQESDFRGDLGFIPQVDQYKFVIGGSRKWYADPGQNWTLFRIYSDWDITKNDNNELIEKETQVVFSVDAKYNSFFRLELMHRDRVGSRHDKSKLDIDGNTTLFTEKRVDFYTQIKPINGLKLAVGTNYGDAIDFSNNRLGTRFDISPRVDWNINEHLEMRLRLGYRTMNADNKAGKEDEVFTAKLVDARTTYQFDIQSFLRFNLIYSHVTRNQDNYFYDEVDTNSHGLSTELLYGYKINPQTVFYLGYSDRHDSEVSFNDLRQNERSVFAKVSYAWIK